MHEKDRKLSNEKTIRNTKIYRIYNFKRIITVRVVKTIVVAWKLAIKKSLTPNFFRLLTKNLNHDLSLTRERLIMAILVRNLVDQEFF
jgi:hypothetical protein